MFGAERKRTVAAGLALLGAVQPTPLPLSGLHKFYLGQPRWGVVYLLLAWTQIPRIASAIEGIWYLSQGESAFQQRFVAMAKMPIIGSQPPAVAPLPAEHVNGMATALRELEQLRQEGLISEHEFEQKRRYLLAQLG